MQQVFLTQNGVSISDTLYSKLTKKTWRLALAEEAGAPQLTSRGLRYGAVTAARAQAPESSE